MGSFYKVMVTSNHGAGRLIYSCLNNPIFWNFGLCAACWARSMCHHKVWPTSAREVSIALYALGWKTNVSLPGCFPYILFYSFIFSLISSGWFVIAVFGAISPQGTILRVDCGLSMWGTIITPMYRYWLHGLYGLHGSRCPLLEKKSLILDK